MEQKFMELVKNNDGFEITLGFRDFVDHFLGGRDNKVWYCIAKDNDEEAWIGEYDGNAWSDRHVVVHNKEFSEENIEAGTTIAKITERAYFKQDAIASDGRKPVSVDISGQKCSHYTFSFGARAYDILDDYGITACYSNIDDETAGYRMRNVVTGKKVKAPKL